MAHEWTQEQKDEARKDLIARGLFDVSPRLLNFQCSINAVHKLLAAHIEAWLSRNPQPPKEAK